MTGNNQVMNCDPDSNLRYVGNSPKNYVWFNKEIWRVIGVFDGQVKIIRDEYYNDGNGVAFDFGSINGGTHGTYGYNDWSQSIIKSELNDGASSFLESIKSRDFVSYGYIDLDHVWNIGGTADVCNDVVMFNWRTDMDQTAYTECSYNSWLYDNNHYKWTMIPDSDRYTNVFYIHINGAVGYNLVNNTNFKVLPVLYLNSDVIIIGGNGTYNQPFLLGI